MATFYIIYSKSTEKFYSGSTLDYEMQLEQHQKNHFPKGYISNATDWSTFFKIDNLEIDTARRIEKHVKKNKSKEYFQRLTQDPALKAKLIEEFSTHRNRQ